MANGVTITWLGHGTFLFDSPGGKRVLLDPWIENNPSFPEDWKSRIAERLDVIALTHGHFDHLSELVSLAQRVRAPILCIFDQVPFLTRQGLAEDRFIGFNLGGTVEAAGIRFTMTQAFHSSSITDEAENIVYLGHPAGYVMHFEDGTVVYHTGDTCVFGDMRIIGELYSPDVVIMPIGGHFTMDPMQAAYAAKLIGTKRIIPEHYGTFPLLAGSPEELRQRLAGQDFEVIALEPAQSTTINRSA